MSILKFQPIYSKSYPKNYSHLIDYLVDSESNYLSKKENLITDFLETEEVFLLKIELPGVKKEDIKLDVLDKILVVSAEKKQFEESKELKYIKTESSFGFYERSYPLPENVNKEAIKANYLDGILQITLPKDKELPKKTQVIIE